MTLVTFVLLTVVGIILGAILLVTFLNFCPNDTVVNSAMFPSVKLDPLVQKSMPFIKLAFVGNVDQETAYYTNGDTDAENVIIFAHGNAGNIEMMWANVTDRLVTTFGSTNVCAYTFDYKPEENMSSVSPASAVAQWQKLHTHILEKHKNLKHLIIYGRSIGGAVSVHGAASILAENKQEYKTSLVLETPFLGTHSTNVPGATYIAERFGCIAEVQEINRHDVDVVAFLANDDEIINNRVVKEYLTAIVRGGKLRLVEIPDCTHNDVYSHRVWSDTCGSLVQDKE